jgi:hypothetical protein
MKWSVEHGAAEEFGRTEAGTKRGEPKPAHRRRSSKGSVRIASLRPLVLKVRASPPLVVKRLKQLLGDRLGEHILPKLTQRLVEVDIWPGQMVDRPATCGPRRSGFHKATLVGTNVDERATGLVVPHPLSHDG